MKKTNRLINNSIFITYSIAICFLSLFLLTSFKSNIAGAQDSPPLEVGEFVTEGKQLRVDSSPESFISLVSSSDDKIILGANSLVTLGNSDVEINNLETLLIAEISSSSYTIDSGNMTIQMDSGDYAIISGDSLGNGNSGVPSIGVMGGEINIINETAILSDITELTSGGFQDLHDRDERSAFANFIDQVFTSSSTLNPFHVDDLDGDGLPHHNEMIVSTDPSDPNSFPDSSIDLDGNGVPDWIEAIIGPGIPDDTDFDNDGYPDWQEEVMGSNPDDIDSVPSNANIDTDGDGVSDMDETLLGRNPNDASDADKDTDGDGIPDNHEINVIGTDPNGFKLVDTLTLSFDKDLYDLVNGDPNNEQPVLTVTPVDSYVTHNFLFEITTSTPPAPNAPISIDSSTGELLPLSPGTATIKVTRLEDENYEAAEATYDVQVINNEILISSITINPKVFDDSADATSSLVLSSAEFEGLNPGDAVMLETTPTSTAVYNTSDSGTDKTITLTDYTVRLISSASGISVTYNLQNPQIIDAEKNSIDPGLDPADRTIEITPIELTISGAEYIKYYDTTNTIRTDTDVEVSSNPNGIFDIGTIGPGAPLPGHIVTHQIDAARSSYNDETVGSGKGLTLSYTLNVIGTSASNYVIHDDSYQSPNYSARIDKAPVTLNYSNVGFVSRPYDGTVDIDSNGVYGFLNLRNSTLSGINFDTTPTYEYLTPDVGTNKSATMTDSGALDTTSNESYFLDTSNFFDSTSQESLVRGDVTLTPIYISTIDTTVNSLDFTKFYDRTNNITETFTSDDLVIVDQGGDTVDNITFDTLPTIVYQQTDVLYSGTSPTDMPLLIDNYGVLSSASSANYTLIANPIPSAPQFLLRGIIQPTPLNLKITGTANRVYDGTNKVYTGDQSITTQADGTAFTPTYEFKVPVDSGVLSEEIISTNFDTAPTLEYNSVDAGTRSISVTEEDLVSPDNNNFLLNSVYDITGLTGTISARDISVSGVNFVRAFNGTADILDQTAIEALPDYDQDTDLYEIGTLDSSKIAEVDENDVTRLNLSFTAANAAYVDAEGSEIPSSAAATEDINLELVTDVPAHTLTGSSSANYNLLEVSVDSALIRKVNLIIRYAGRTTTDMISEKEYDGTVNIPSTVNQTLISYDYQDNDGNSVTPVPPVTFTVHPAYIYDSADVANTETTFTNKAFEQNLVLDNEDDIRMDDVNEANYNLVFTTLKTDVEKRGVISPALLNLTVTGTANRVYDGTNKVYTGDQSITTQADGTAFTPTYELALVTDHPITGSTLPGDISWLDLTGTNSVTYTYPDALASATEKQLETADDFVLKNTYSNNFKIDDSNITGLKGTISARDISVSGVNFVRAFNGTADILDQTAIEALPDYDQDTDLYEIGTLDSSKIAEVDENDVTRLNLSFTAANAAYVDAEGSEIPSSAAATEDINLELVTDVPAHTLTGSSSANYNLLEVSVDSALIRKVNLIIRYAGRTTTDMISEKEYDGTVNIPSTVNQTLISYDYQDNDGNSVTPVPPVTFTVHPAYIYDSADVANTETTFTNKAFEQNLVLDNEDDIRMDDVNEANYNLVFTTLKTDVEKRGVISPALLNLTVTGTANRVYDGTNKVYTGDQSITTQADGTAFTPTYELALVTDHPITGSTLPGDISWLDLTGTNSVTYTYPDALASATEKQLETADDFVLKNTYSNNFKIDDSNITGLKGTISARDISVSGVNFVRAFNGTADILDQTAIEALPDYDQDTDLYEIGTLDSSKIAEVDENDVTRLNLSFTAANAAYVDAEGSEIPSSAAATEDINLELVTDVPAHTLTGSSSANYNLLEVSVDSALIRKVNLIIRYAGRTTTDMISEKEYDGTVNIPSTVDQTLISYDYQDNDGNSVTPVPPVTFTVHPAYIYDSADVADTGITFTNKAFEQNLVLDNEDDIRMDDVNEANYNLVFTALKTDVEIRGVISPALLNLTVTGTANRVYDGTNKVYTGDQSITTQADGTAFTPTYELALVTDHPITGSTLPGDISWLDLTGTNSVTYTYPDALASATEKQLETADDFVLKNTYSNNFKIDDSNITGLKGTISARDISVSGVNFVRAFNGTADILDQTAIEALPDYDQDTDLYEIGTLDSSKIAEVDENDVTRLNLSFTAANAAYVDAEGSEIPSSAAATEDINLELVTDVPAHTLTGSSSANYNLLEVSVDSALIRKVNLIIRYAGRTTTDMISEKEYDGTVNIPSTVDQTLISYDYQDNDGNSVTPVPPVTFTVHPAYIYDSADVADTGITFTNKAFEQNLVLDNEDDIRMDDVNEANYNLVFTALKTDVEIRGVIAPKTLNVSGAVFTRPYIKDNSSILKENIDRLNGNHRFDSLFTYTIGEYEPANLVDPSDDVVLEFDPLNSGYTEDPSSVIEETFAGTDKGILLSRNDNPAYSLSGSDASSYRVGVVNYTASITRAPFEIDFDRSTFFITPRTYDGTKDLTLDSGTIIEYKSLGAPVENSFDDLDVGGLLTTSIRVATFEYESIYVPAGYDTDQTMLDANIVLKTGSSTAGNTNDARRYERYMDQNPITTDYIIGDDVLPIKGKINPVEISVRDARFIKPYDGTANILDGNVSGANTEFNDLIDSDIGDLDPTRIVTPNGGVRDNIDINFTASNAEYVTVLGGDVAIDGDVGDEFGINFNKGGNAAYSLTSPDAAIQRSYVLSDPVVDFSPGTGSVFDIVKAPLYTSFEDISISNREFDDSVDIDSSLINSSGNAAVYKFYDAFDAEISGVSFATDPIIEYETDTVGSDKSVIVGTEGSLMPPHENNYAIDSSSNISDSVKGITGNITLKMIYIAGVTATLTKVYDGTDDVTTTLTSSSYQFLDSNDEAPATTVTFNVLPSLEYISKDVSVDGAGDPIAMAINIANYGTLSSTDLALYSLESNDSKFDKEGIITKLEVIVDYSDLSVSDKVYDGTRDAVFSGNLDFLDPSNSNDSIQGSAAAILPSDILSGVVLKFTDRDVIGSEEDIVKDTNMELLLTSRNNYTLDHDSNYASADLEATISTKPIAIENASFKKYYSGDSNIESDTTAPNFNDYEIGNLVSSSIETDPESSDAVDTVGISFNVSNSGYVNALLADVVNSGDNYRIDLRSDPYTLTGAHASNYELDFSAYSATVEILRANLYIDFEDLLTNTSGRLSKAYDGNTNLLVQPNSGEYSFFSDNFGGTTLPAVSFATDPMYRFSSKDVAYTGLVPSAVSLELFNSPILSSNISRNFVLDTSNLGDDTLNGTFEEVITPASLSVDGEDLTKEYDGSVDISRVNGVGTVFDLGNLVGLVSGEDLDYSLPSTSVYLSSNVGTDIGVSVGYVLSDGTEGLASNYELDRSSITGEITKVNLYVNKGVLAATTREYDGTDDVDVPNGLTNFGFELSDGTAILNSNVSFNASGVLYSYEDADAGADKSIIMSGLVLTGTSLTNYDLSYDEFDLVGEVEPKVLSVINSNIVKHYDNTDNLLPSYTGYSIGEVDSSDGFVGLDSLELFIESGGSYDSVDVGDDIDLSLTYSVRVGSAPNNVGDPDNYTVDSSGVIGDIVPRDIRIVDYNFDKVYDKSRNLNLSGSNVELGEIAAVSGTLPTGLTYTYTLEVSSIFSNANVGSYTNLTLSFASTSISSTNFNFIGTGYSAEITKKPVTIVNTSIVKPYDTTNVVHLSGAGGSVLDFGILVEDDLMRSPIPSTDLDIEVVNTLTYNSVVVGSNIKINGSLGIIDGTTDVANNYELRDPLNDTSNLSDANVGEITRATITLTPSTTPGFSVSDKTFDATTGVPSSLVTGDINLVNNYGTSLSLAAAELTSYRFTHPDENVGSDKDLFIVLETTSNYTTLYTDPDRSSVSSLNSNVVPRELRAIYRNPGSGRTFDKYYDTTTVVNSTEEGSHDFYSLVDSTDASINRFPFSNFAPIVDTTTDISYNFEDANVGTNKNISLSGLILDANESVNNNYSLNLTSYSTTGDISATPLTVDLSKYELLDKNYDGTTAVNSQDPDNVTEPGYYTLKDPNNRIVFDSRNPTPNFLSTEITYTYPQKDVLFTSNTVRAMSIVGTTPALNPSQSNNYSIAPVSGLTKSAKINPVNFSITGYNISKGWDNLTYIRGSNSTLTFEFTTVDNILATNEIASGELVLPVKNDFTTISTTSKNVGNTTISSTTKLDIKKADGSTNYNYIVGTETLPGKVAMQGRDVTIEVAELVLTASSSNEMYYRKNFDGTTNKGTSTSLTNDVISTTSIGSFFNVTSTNSSLTSINITLADYTTSSPNVNTSGNELVALNSISVTLPTTHQNNVSIEYKDNSDNAADLKDLIYAKITPIAAYINFTPDLAFEDYTQREETRGTRVTTPFNISSGSIIFENAAGNELPLIGDVTYELFPNSDRPGTRSVYIRNVSFANATDNANMSVQYQGTYAGFRTSAGTPSVVIIKNEITYRAATNFTATKVFDNTTTVSYTGDLEQVDSYGQVINIPVNSVTLRYEDVNVGTDKTLIFASTPTISSTNIYYYDINTTLNANMIGNITPLDVTVTGHNFIKEYDGNTTFNSTITGSTVSAERDIGELNNALAKTLFNISISNLEFPQSNIGTDLTLSGNYTLTAVSGTDISNINFTDPLAAGSITGNIIPTTLTISRNSLSIGNKEYDGTTAINNDLITGTIRIINSINADVTVDDVVDSLTFVFASSNVASNIATTPTLTLVTAYDNTNYTISHNSTNSIENITANIVLRRYM